MQEEYVFFNGSRIARRDVQSNQVHYYFSNHLDSASVITDSSGNVQQQTDYYPYGGIAYSSGTDGNHYKFTGKERDAESGLDNFGARYYTSNIGRFMTPDWAARPTAVPYAVFGEPQTLNLYTYVENAPVNRADADGHRACGDKGKDILNKCINEDTEQSNQEQTARNQAQNNGVDGKTIGKGAGEVVAGGGLITLTILLAPETGGGSLAALGIFMGVMGGEAEIGKGTIDIAKGSGAIGDKTAEEGKQGVDLATNPVSAAVLPFTSPKTAGNIGSVASGAMGLHDLAKRPENFKDALNKLSSARDVKEGYQSAKELLQQANSWLMNKAMSLTPYF